MYRGLFGTLVTRVAITQLILSCMQSYERHYVGRPKDVTMKLRFDHFRRNSAFSLVEVVVGAALLAMLSISLLAAFSAGLGIVRAGRENMRATQILMQKTETLRL